MVGVRHNVFISFGEFQEFLGNKKSEILRKSYVMWNSAFMKQF